MPPPDEMALLSQEYQDLWRTSDAELIALLDEPGRQSTKLITPAEYAFDQGTEQMLRKSDGPKASSLLPLPGWKSSLPTMSDGNKSF